jgi:hypothetical protein
MQSGACTPVCGLFYRAFVDASSPPKAAVTFIHNVAEQGGWNDRLLSEAINLFVH